MAIVWTDGLSVGVKVIDQQHQEMIKRINRLLDAMQGGKGGKETEGAIEFLEEYVVVHFGAEEELMKSTPIPRCNRTLSSTTISARKSPACEHRLMKGRT
jgi:hemerythrin